MTPEGESSGPNSLGEAIKSQHPGIVQEIEGAIKTLHKLKGLAGTGDSEPPPADLGGGLQATIAATAALSSALAGAQGAGTQPIARTEAESYGVAEVPLLANCSTFGRYQIVRLLGKGAMGAVYLAYDTQLHRHVALKTPLLGQNSQAIQRFFREARAAANLRSPYLCPVYDAGQIGQLYYLSMAFIDGQPLTRAILDGRLRTVAEAKDVVKKVAQGLQKAHEQGIIHRDLKPDNIMIDQDGEPIVMDFGLARRLDEGGQVTMSGVIVGTPAYMSPEQVEGNPLKIGPATDIYSLGVILYQMLTGRLPFQGSLTAILRQIGNDLPPRPSTLNADLGEDSPLEQVCLKMMAKAQEDRYTTMAEVVAALDGLTPRQDAPVVKPSGRGWIKSLASGIFSSRARPGSGSGAAPKSSVEKPPTDPSAETIADP